MKLTKKIDTNFTVVHNDFLFDQSLGIAARGLLMTMLALPEYWNFSIHGLAAILPEGERKISTTLKELEEAKYLVRIRKCKAGKVVDWEYIVSDTILPDEVLSKSFRNKNKKNDNDRDNNHEKKTDINEESQKGEKYDEEPHVQNVDVAVLDVINPCNNKELSNKELNNKLLSKSINQSEKIDEIKINRQIIKENIGYDVLQDIEDKDMLDELVEIITDTVSSESNTTRVGKEFKPTQVVKSMFLKLKDGHIQYVLNNLRNTTTQIKNVKAYIITALYNSLMTINSHYQMIVNHDLYGETEELKNNVQSYSASLKPLFGN